MTLPAKWADRRERPKFLERVGLAQPVLAAGALAFFSLLFGLPVLFLLNQGFEPALAPASVLADFRLGSAYNAVSSTLTDHLSQLIAQRAVCPLVACWFVLSLLLFWHGRSP